MLLRAMERIPWQVHAATGCSVLAAAPLLAEVWERETPLVAASHNGGAASSVNAEAVQRLRQEGFVIGQRRTANNRLYAQPLLILALTRVSVVRNSNQIL